MEKLSRGSLLLNDLVLMGYSIKQLTNMAKQQSITPNKATNQVPKTTGKDELSGSKNGKNYTLDKSKSTGNTTYKKASGANVPKIDVSKLKESASLPKKGGETVVGHALQKHAGRNPDIWGKIKGNAQEINKTAMRHLEEILNASGDFKVVKTKNGVSFLEKQLPDGRGIRLNMDGSFKGFIDQIR